MGKKATKKFHVYAHRYIDNRHVTAMVDEFDTLQEAAQCYDEQRAEWSSLGLWFSVQDFHFVGKANVDIDVLYDLAEGKIKPKEVKL